MKLLRRYPVMAFTLVLLSIVASCIAQGSFGLMTVAGGLAAMSWFVTEGPRGRALPRWVSNILTIGVGLNVMVDFIQHMPDYPGVLARFTIGLTLIKLYERKSARDHAQLLALSLLLMLTGCLMTSSLLFGAALALYAALGLHVLLLYQVYRGFERARQARMAEAPSGYRLTPQVQPIVGRSAGRQVRWLAAVTGAAGAALSLLVFIVAPRDFERSLISTGPGASGEAEAGFNETGVDLITGSRISDSRRIVAHLELLDSEGQPRHLPWPILLRGSVQCQYVGRGRWSPCDGEQAVPIATQPPSFTRLGRTDLPIEAMFTQRFTMFLRERTVFSMAVPVMISTPAPTRFNLDPQTQMLRHLGPRPLESYEVKAAPSLDDQAIEAFTFAAGESLAAPSTTMAMSGSRRAIHGLATRLLTDAGLTPAPPADAALRWNWHRDAAAVFASFLRSGRFEYTTDLRGLLREDEHGRAKDPIVTFLFDTQRGHCEYFASALARLCDSVDIPARLITGYAAVEYDDGAEHYVIRESNAHAWTEVRTGPARWSTIDSTPVGTLSALHAPARGLGDWARSLYDRFDFKWTTSVVLFDGNDQRRLVETFASRASARLSDAADATMEWMRSVNRTFAMGPAGYVWLGLVGFALVLAGIAAVKLTRRWLKLRAAAHLEHLHGRAYRRAVRRFGFYLDMLDVLARGGRPKPAHVPPRRFADDLARDRPDAGALVAQLTGLFYEARYGGCALDHADVMRAREWLASLALALDVKP
jgi:hypothetical protein